MSGNGAFGNFGKDAFSERDTKSRFAFITEPFVFMRTMSNVNENVRSENFNSFCVFNASLVPLSRNGDTGSLRKNDRMILLLDVPP